jgi:tRNA nucleotidyltransferase (CCA-adding enzyme)
VDDPTRALRAIKYAVRFGFRMERAFPRRLAKAREAGAFDALTGDRYRKGIEEILGEERFEEGVRLLLHYRLLDDVLNGWNDRATDREADPEIASKGMKATESVEARWSVLLHPLALDERRAVARRLLFPRKLRRAAGVPLR